MAQLGSILDKCEDLIHITGLKPFLILEDRVWKTRFFHFGVMCASHTALDSNYFAGALKVAQDNKLARKVFWKAEGDRNRNLEDQKQAGRQFLPGHCCLNPNMTDSTFLCL